MQFSVFRILLFATVIACSLCLASADTAVAFTSHGRRLNGAEAVVEGAEKLAESKGVEKAAEKVAEQLDISYAKGKAVGELLAHLPEKERAEAFRMYNSLTRKKTHLILKIAKYSALAGLTFLAGYGAYQFIFGHEPRKAPELIPTN